MHHGGGDLKRERDGFAAKGSSLRNEATEIPEELARE